MKKSILVSIAFILSFLNIQAQLLWRITGNGLKQPSYILGTQQLVSIQFFDSIPGLYKAFSNCEVVVGEVAINNIDATSKIQQAAIMPNHEIIKDLLNDDQYKLVDNELKAVMKLGLKEVSIMNPSLVETLYKMEIFKKRTGFSEDKQSDSYFQLVAAEKGKDVIGLESVDQQIKIQFGNGSLEQQADNLVETVQHKDSILANMLLINKLYKAGKIDGIYELSKGKANTTDLTGDGFVQIIDNQNAEWILKLSDLMKKSSCFITVSAIHLGGKNGLIKELQKSGYKIKAVE